MKYREHLVVSKEHGKVSAEVQIIDRRRAIELSRMSETVVLSMDEGEWHNVYRGGVESFERFDGLYVGKHASFDGHLGWLS